ncbi:hypothetical protein IWW52_005379, partial [Coemansia sp. RSA 2704]
ERNTNAIPPQLPMSPEEQRQRQLQQQQQLLQQQQQTQLQQLPPPQAIPSSAYRSQAVPAASQQQYRSMQGMPPAAGMDQMQQLSAAYQPQDMGAQAAGTMPPPMGYTMQSLPSSQAPPVVHGAPHAMVYNQPQSRKMVPPSDRMILRSGARANTAQIVSNAPPAQGVLPHQRYRQNQPEDVPGSPAGVNPYNDAL